jgi:hypothetical protein
MNFSRGLFRLWLVLAACYVPIAVYVNHSNFSSIEWASGPQPGDFVLPSDRHLPPAPKSSFKPSECKHTSLRQLVDKNTKLDFFDCLDRRNWAPNWEQRIWAVSAVAIPPILLLLLGFAILWVARGFRRSDPPQR